MKKIVLALTWAVCLLFASCASNHFNSFSEFPVIESGDLDSGRYIVLGEVSGASNLSMTNEEYSKLISNEFSYEPQNINVKFGNDSGEYGFIGKRATIKMNVFERSAALAEYKMIQTAKFNGADAIICFKSETKVENSYKTTIVKTYVSGLAVKVKADNGYSIKTPVEEVEAPAVEETEPESVSDSDDDEVSEVSE